MKCILSNCENEKYQKGWCQAHYLRWYKYGDPNILKRKRGSLIERFNFMVNKVSGGCWEWQGSVDKGGYGRITNEKGNLEFVHRVSYKLFIGKIPENKVIHHKCFNTSCANPEHLEPVTMRENIIDFGKTGFSAVNFRKKYCPKGHKYTLDNIYRRPNSTSRYCRACAKINSNLQNKKRSKKYKQQND